MPWQTIVICSACYRVRQDTDDMLVDRPVRYREHQEVCHDCGSHDADIPIRADVQPTQKEE